MNNDLISREALKAYARKVICGDNPTNTLLIRMFDEIIDNAPAVGLIQSLTELCNRYCENCPIIDTPNECSDCICTHIRGIIKGGAE